MKTKYLVWAAALYAAALVSAQELDDNDPIECQPHLCGPNQVFNPDTCTCVTPRPCPGVWCPQGFHIVIATCTCEQDPPFPKQPTKE